jgi:hypothetical protein
MSGYVTMKGIGDYGRFANGIYQIAGVIGIARRNGLNPVFPLWQNRWHRDAFGSREDIEIHEHLVNPLPSIPEGLTFTDRFVDWGYHDIVLPSGNWNLSGHFQSSKYFEHCKDEVRERLKMKDEPPQNDYVAVHIRLGDYDNLYHPRLNMDYYGPAMSQFPGEKFLVFSDSLDEAKNLFGNSVEYSEGRDYIQDFKLMKNCKSFIIGNSSYSAFAAVLGEHPEKRVIAPRPWFGKGYTNITGEDIYESEWTVIDYKKAA